MLENFTAVRNEQRTHLERCAAELWIQDLEVTLPRARHRSGRGGRRFEQAFSGLERARRRATGFNRSCSPPGRLAAGRRLRAVCRYCFMTGCPSALRYMESVLSRQPFIAQR